MKPPKTTVGALLIATGACESMEAASALIMSGDVIVTCDGHEEVAKSAAAKHPTHATIRLRNRKPFVSRAGDKLSNAIKIIIDQGLTADFAEKVVFDIGASTGGFCDCALKLGAKKVYTVDVGTNQLDWKLRSDPRVSVHEKTDVRTFVAPEPPDWILVDVSFNSIARLATAIAGLGRAGLTRYLILVKPQFELPEAEIPKGGVVVDTLAIARAVGIARKALEKNGIIVQSEIAASPKGQDGNQEVFLLAR